MERSKATLVSVVSVVYANIHVKNRQLEELKYQSLIADHVVYLFYWPCLQRQKSRRKHAYWKMLRKCMKIISMFQCQLRNNTVAGSPCCSKNNTIVLIINILLVRVIFSIDIFLLEQLQTSLHEPLISLLLRKVTSILLVLSRYINFW